MREIDFHFDQLITFGEKEWVRQTGKEIWRLRKAESNMFAVEAEELREALLDLLSRMSEPGCSEHTLGAFLHGSGVANARLALAMAALAKARRDAISVGDCSNG